jgi:hypothetical protein
MIMHVDPDSRIVAADSNRSRTAGQASLLVSEIEATSHNQSTQAIIKSAEGIKEEDTPRR